MARLDPSGSSNPTQAAAQGASSSKKRKFKVVYTPTAKEQFPDVPWYNLDYQMIIDMVNEMLDEIIVRL
jgi:hypothetical protein